MTEPGSWVLIDDPRLAWVVLGGGASALFVFAWWLVPRRPQPLRLVGVLAAALWPFLLPAEAGPERMFVVGYAVVFAAKMWERGVGRAVDEWSFGRFGCFVVWWFLPPDHRWPRSKAEARQNRRVGLRRVGRGTAALFLWLAMLLLAGVVDVHDNAVIGTAWSLMVIYGFVAAIADGVCGLAMLAGLQVAEVFQSPVIARNPSDFWARRWNRYINEFARRHIFFACTDRLGIRGAALAVFVASGLMHEYLIVAWNAGPGRYTGWTLAFFLIQGLGVLVGHLVGGRRWPRLVAIAAHVAWMMVTTPLFFEPLDEAIGFRAWRIELP